MSFELNDDQYGLPASFHEEVLEQAREVACKALDRLRNLAGHLPEGALEQVEKLHEDPAAERRKAARLVDRSIRVGFRAEDLLGETGGEVKDHCPRGLAVLLPCPAGVGTVLRIRIPPELGGDAWVSVEVRHCRREADGWVAGCELVGDQPPL